MLKRRPSVGANGKVVITFTSSVPDSTFLCSIGGKKFRSCTSPLRKRFGPGKHKIRIQAVSPLGVPDPTPLKVPLRLAPET